MQTAQADEQMGPDAPIGEHGDATGTAIVRPEAQARRDVFISSHVCPGDLECRTGTLERITLDDSSKVDIGFSLAEPALEPQSTSSMVRGLRNEHKRDQADDCVKRHP